MSPLTLTHELQGAGQRGGAGREVQRVEGACTAEVHQLHHVEVGDHDVVGLQVQVEDPAVVQVLHALQHLHQVGHHVVLRVPEPGNTHAGTRTHKRTQTSSYADAQAPTHTQIRAHTRTHAGTQTHTHTQADTQTHTHRLTRRFADTRLHQRKRTRHRQFYKGFLSCPSFIGLFDHRSLVLSLYNGERETHRDTER